MLFNHVNNDKSNDTDTRTKKKKHRRNKKLKTQSEKELLKHLYGGSIGGDDDADSENHTHHMNTINTCYCTPKNEHQQRLQSLLNDPSKKIVIATGPAGTGKTLFTTQTAIRFFLAGKFDKLVFTRPSVAVDEELGFLPGTLEEKMAPWMRPIYDILYTHISPKEVHRMVEDKIIEIAPLGFMRGRTFKHSCIVADEAQNCTPNQMMMLLTRIGEGSRMFITGDLEQCDLARTKPRRTNSICSLCSTNSNSSSHDINNNSNNNNNNSYQDETGSGLEDFLLRVKARRSDSISSIEFETTDVEREQVVKEVLDIYAKLN